MADLDVSGFASFFKGVTDHQPFPWQVALVEELLEGRVPEVIDVPTGLGKTSVIHCWAYALAARPDGALPRRLCFVVDRRLVVDGAHEDASDLAGVLDDGAASDGVVGTVAARLRALHDDGSLRPLEVVRMRGGVTWESRWLARPDQAAVVVGTVDQYGSRLLFRGYGGSSGMRPIDAALVGTDSWLVIDEAHIAEPLVQTAESASAYQGDAVLSSVGPLRVTRMSATVQGGEQIFRADPDRQMRSQELTEAAEVARRRLQVSKPVTLVDVTNLAKASRKKWRETSGKLGRALADLGRTVAPDAKVVGVVANTIGTARAAHERLEAAGEQAILLIGRSRNYEREQLRRQWLPRFEVGADRSGQDERLFVVATQTIEVGANLDLDALVTECAPLSSLIQRFGRVNRLGDREPHRSTIVHAGFAHGEDDPVYGRPTAETWEYLTDSAGSYVEVATSARKTECEWPEAPELDLGLLPARQLADEAPSEVRPKRPFTPVLLGAHLERWAATHPAPFPDQKVDPFLHGVGRVVPEVQVAWRARPPARIGDDEHGWGRWLDLVRPVEWEFVSVPIWELRGLLADEPSQVATSDLEGTPPVEEEEFEQTGGTLLGVVYRGPEQSPRAVRGPNDDVEVGDRVVLASDVGGHDRWGWTGRRRAEGAPAVPDVADLAPTRRRPSLRLAPEVFHTFVGSEVAAEDVDDAFGSLAVDDPETVEGVVDALGMLPFPSALMHQVEQARAWRAITTETTSGGEQPLLVLTEPRGGRAAFDAVSDSDVATTSTSEEPQSLAEHGREVGELAARFAAALNLSDVVARTVELAARWHDLGKADPRFQLMLHDGDDLAAAAAEEPLAKSGRDPRDPIARRARAVSRLPAGFRHEAVSARVVDEGIAQGVLEEDSLDLELLHHLVVSHHGRGRPLLPAVRDPEAPQVAATIEGQIVKVEGREQQVDWSHPARFEALNARYGSWGLALLETLVRLSDMRCSEVSP